MCICLTPIQNICKMICSSKNYLHRANAGKMVRGMHTVYILYNATNSIYKYWLF